MRTWGWIEGKKRGGGRQRRACMCQARLFELPTLLEKKRRKLDRKKKVRREERRDHKKAHFETLERAKSEENGRGGKIKVRPPPLLEALLIREVMASPKLLLSAEAEATPQQEKGSSSREKPRQKVLKSSLRNWTRCFGDGSAQPSTLSFSLSAVCHNPR